MVCYISKKYVFWVTLRPQSDCCCRGEAEVRILDFKTTWSEFQKPCQTAATEAKPRYVYSILKPHGQSFRGQVRLLSGEAKPSYVYTILKNITSPKSVPSSYVRLHTLDVPMQLVLHSYLLTLRINILISNSFSMGYHDFSMLSFKRVENEHRRVTRTA